MIQKRYQYYSSKGIEWTEWLDYEEDNTLLSYLKENFKWQLRPLKNEYKIV